MGITLKDQTERFRDVTPVLSNWKRWSRLFLPVDDYSLKGGRERELSLNESFELLLAGHLIAELKFSVIEAQQIIVLTKPWMMDRGFYPDCPEYEPPEDNVNFWTIITGASVLVGDESTKVKAIGHIGSKRRWESGRLVCRDTYIKEEIEWKDAGDSSTTTIHVYALLSNFLMEMNEFYHEDTIKNFITSKGLITSKPVPTE